LSCGVEQSAKECENGDQIRMGLADTLVALLFFVSLVTLVALLMV
jgi:hypothetical protein